VGSSKRDGFSDGEMAKWCVAFTIDGGERVVNDNGHNRRELDVREDTKMFELSAAADSFAAFGSIQVRPRFLHEENCRGQRRASMKIK